MNRALILPSDRRAFGREARLTRARIVPVSRASTPATPGACDAIVVNVGEGGLQVTTDSEIRTGAPMRVAFDDPGIPEVLATVVWVRRNRTRVLGDYTAGLVFKLAGQPGVARLLAAQSDTAE